MTIVICPGIHRSHLTQHFIADLQWSHQPLIFPAEATPVYSPRHVLKFLSDANLTEPLLLVAFSAGVVGAIGAAHLWQNQGGSIKALIAVDGWGVPLSGNFPIHRMSHDHFTAWSSALLDENSSDSFYADPAVEHLTLWRSPQTVHGHWISANKERSPISTTAASFITALLQRYEASA